MQPIFELNHLKYFYFTVREGSVAGAADRLAVQQPVISKMLRSLEDRFQNPLFRKSGRKKVLTDFGQIVYRHCQVVFYELERLEQLRADQPKLSGPLHLGCTDAVAPTPLATILKKMKINYPSVHVNIYTSTAQHLLDLLSQRQLALGLFFHLPTLPSSLEVIAKIPVRFHLVVAQKEKKNAAVIERFIGSREIDDTSTQRFPTLERMRRHYPKAHIALSSNQIRFHKDLVLEGFGSAILPEYFIHKELKNKTLVDLYPQEKFIFDLKIVTSKTSPLPMAAQVFLEQWATS